MIYSYRFNTLMNTIYGYWRCSTDAQDQERQIRALKEAGCEVIVGDKITGTSNYGDREALAKLLNEIEEGSLIILDELSRLGRTMGTMLVEVNKLLDKGVKIRTLDGRLDTQSMNEEIVKLIVSVMGYAAEMELKNISNQFDVFSILGQYEKSQKDYKSTRWLFSCGSWLVNNGFFRNITIHIYEYN